MKTLDLVLKTCWYDMIAKGEKREEYREIKPYWERRLATKDFTHVRFRRGYTNTTMLFKIDCITIGKGNPQWGAPEDKDVFIIKFSEAKREFKFRGKTPDGEWVYGSHVPFSCSIFKKHNHLIIVGNGTLNRKGDLVFPDHSYYVIEETIGQYTGLKDKNGKEIYEGDILAKKTTGEIIGWVKGGVRGYCYDVVYVNHPAGEKSWSLFGTVKYDYPDNIIVVGNIYDNHELLEDVK